jgi:hypothetical protein
MRPEPGGDAALGADRTERTELGLAVEPVARLRLEGRRPGAQHPAAVSRDGLAQAFLAGGTRRPHGREDSAPSGVQLLVRRTRGAQGELLDPVAAEAGVGVAVDEPGHRAEASAVQLLDLAVERRQLAHAAGRRHAPVLAEQERVLDQDGLAQGAPAQRRGRARRRGELLEVADEQLARRFRGAHSSPVVPIGASSPPRRAASAASS